MIYNYANEILRKRKSRFLNNSKEKSRLLIFLDHLCAQKISSFCSRSKLILYDLLHTIKYWNTQNARFIRGRLSIKFQSNKNLILLLLLLHFRWIQVCIGDWNTMYNNNTHQSVECWVWGRVVRIVYFCIELKFFVHMYCIPYEQTNKNIRLIYMLLV